MISFFEKYNKLCWAITIIVAIAIFIISSLTFEDNIYFAGNNLNSTLYHFLSFFLLGFFLLMSILGRTKNYQLFFIGIILALIYGALDELHQFFVPGRFCSFTDFFTNSSGIFFASLIHFFKITK